MTMVSIACQSQYSGLKDDGVCQARTSLLSSCERGLYTELALLSGILSGAHCSAICHNAYATIWIFASRGNELPLSLKSSNPSPGPHSLNRSTPAPGA